MLAKHTSMQNLVQSTASRNQLVAQHSTMLNFKAAAVICALDVPAVGAFGSAANKAALEAGPDSRVGTSKPLELWNLLASQ